MREATTTIQSAMFNILSCRGDDWDFRKTPDEGNTGFYFVRSGPHTIKLWGDTIAAVPRFPGLDDQTIFWNVIRSSVDPRIIPLPRCQHYSDSQRAALVSCPLDGCMFSAGALRGVAYVMLTDGLKKRNGTLHTIHANYIKGNEMKKAALNKHGYWLATQSPDKSWNGKCKPFHPMI